MLRQRLWVQINKNFFDAMEGPLYEISLVPGKMFGSSFSYLETEVTDCPPGLQLLI
jgi:hypothetical protein